MKHENDQEGKHSEGRGNDGMRNKIMFMWLAPDLRKNSDVLQA